MKILISGATGLVGSALLESLYKRRDDVTRLVRSVGDQSGFDLVWNPATGATDRSRFEGFDAVVHLAGESIASGRWTEARKRRIRDSRVIGTSNLCSILAALARPPKVLVCASAIGYYGDRADEMLDESSKPGTGFLSDVCQQWEAACAPAATKGVRVVNLRFGIILSPRGGALKLMLLPFKAGVGGILGSGKQFMSWVGLPDVVRAIEKALDDGNLNGPVNVVAPEPVTNATFTETLGTVLSRPTLFPVPAFAARLAFGEMADALLLSSERVTPKKLSSAGFAFSLPTLDGCLRSLLAR